MEIVFLEEVNSTQIYLKEYILENGFTKPLCIVTQNQTSGIGSRGNSWIGKKGNLFFSFAIKKSFLPKDLPMQSSSIYFSYILKQVLSSYGSQVWLKWPNDFYVENKKIGGTITSLKGELFYCGIGLNLVEVSEEFGYLDIKIAPQTLLNDFFIKLEKTPSWKNIFSQFRLEFYKSQFCSTVVDGKRVVLESSELNSDGSISLNNRKVFSLR